MPSKRAAKRGRKAGIPAGSDGSVELGLNGVPVEPQVTEKPPPEPQATEKPPPEQEEVAMAAGKRAAKRGRKPGIPAASDCSVELGLNGVPVEPQVAEKPPPEPAAEVEDGEAEEVEGSQQSEEAEREEEQSDLHSSSKEQSEDEDESMEEEADDGEESMEEEAAGESAPALQSPSKGKRGGKKPAPSARDVVAEKSPPPGDKRRRRNEEPVTSPSPNKRSMVTRSHQPEVPAPEEHEPEDKGHEPEDQEEHEPEDEGAGIIKSKKKKKSKKMRKSAQEDNGPEDEGHEPEDPEERGPEDEGAGIIKGKNKKMRKPAPEEHGPEDQGAEVIKSKKRKSDRIKPAQQKEHGPEDEGHEPEDPEEHGPEDEGARIVKLKKKKSKKMRKPAPEEHEPEDQGAEVIKSKKRKSDRIKPAQQKEHGPEDEGHEPEDPEEHGPEDEGAGIIKGKNKKNKKMRKPAPEEHEPEEQGAEVIKSKKRKSDRIKPAQKQGEPGTSKVKRTRRQWAPNDEILILEQVINYRHTHGGYAPEVQDSSFFESLLKQLGDQSLELRTVKDKMCSLRRRYFKKKHKSTTEHGKRLDNLSEQAWGKLSQVGAKDSSGRNLSKKALRKHSRKDSKSFEEVCEMYPHLAQEVKLIADIHPSAKSPFTRIDARVACKLEKQLDVAKAKISQVRQSLAGVLAEDC